MKKHYVRWLTMLFFMAVPVFAYAAGPLTGPGEMASLSGPVTEQESASVSEGWRSDVLRSDMEDDSMTEENSIPDPLEPWNRAMFTFNDKLYFWVLKPVARGYSAIVPEWGRIRVRNIFQNITMPGRFVNNLLQLKIERAGTELLRFVFNTTVGVGGMFDVAKNIDLKAHEEDLGQTLGVYGIGNGFYLVWPVLGPSSLRDTVGTVGDFFLDPVYYISDTGLRMAVRSLDVTNTTSLHIGDYEDMKESALDPYVSFRDAYFQHRDNKVKK